MGVCHRQWFIPIDRSSTIKCILEWIDHLDKRDGDVICLPLIDQPSFGLEWIRSNTEPVVGERRQTSGYFDRNIFWKEIKLVSRRWSEEQAYAAYWTAIIAVVCALFIIHFEVNPCASEQSRSTMSWWLFLSAALRPLNRETEQTVFAFPVTMQSYR